MIVHVGYWITIRLPLTPMHILFVLAGAVLIGAAATAVAEEAHAVSPPSQACRSFADWTALDAAQPRTVSATERLTAMAARDIVLLGEYHDEDDHHRWQVQTLAALHLLRPNMVIGFEMFPRRMQPVLDRWVAGALSVKEFLG